METTINYVQSTLGKRLLCLVKKGPAFEKKTEPVIKETYNKEYLDKWYAFPCTIVTPDEYEGGNK